MKDKHRNEMDKLFHTAKIRTGEIKQQLKSMENADSRFLEKFKQLCRECIIPTVEDVGNQIKKMGGDYRIEEFHDDQLKRFGERGRPFLRFTIAVPGYDLSDSSKMPNLVFAGDMYRRRVSCRLENLGHLSLANQQVIRQWTIDEITPDKIENAIIAYMKILIPG